MNEMTTLLVLHPIIALAFFVAFTLSVGSALNVIIYRLPQMLETEWRTECCELLKIDRPKPTQVNLFFPRSFCPSCKTMIPFWHNIPIISYCLLLGRCRHCHQPISYQYPLVELLCVVLSLLAAWHFGLTVPLLFVLPFLWILIVLFFIDLKHQILPDSLTLGLLWLGLIANTEGLFTTLPNAVISAGGAYLSLWIFIQLFYLATGKIGMGNGDFKLFAALGAWFGWTMLPLIIVLASLAGTVVGASYLKINQKTKETPIPFGPFLCFFGVIALFYGNHIINWYLRLTIN